MPNVHRLGSRKFTTVTIGRSGNEPVTSITIPMEMTADEAREVSLTLLRVSHQAKNVARKAGDDDA